MKKVIILILAMGLMITAMAGCAKRVPADTATSQPIELTETAMPAEDDSTFDSSKPLNVPKPFAEDAEITTLEISADMEMRLMELGFDEIHLFRDTKRDKLTFQYVDDVVVGSLMMSDSDLKWNFMIEKTNSMESHIDVPASEITSTSYIDQVIDDAEIVFHDCITSNDQFYWIVKVLFPETGNLYTFYTDVHNEPVEDEGRMPIHVVAEEEPIFDSKGRPIYPPYREELEQLYHTPEIRTFKLDINGEQKIYKARLGATMNEWAHSEFNTDGWHMSEIDSLYLLSADNKYALNAYDYAYGIVYADPYTEEETTDVLAYNYRNAYCVNSESDLRIGGFNLLSTTFQEDNFVEYIYSHLSPYFGVTDTITLSGYGTTQENVDKMEVYVIPHTESDKTQEDIMNNTSHRAEYGWPYNNDVETIRTKGTKLDVKYISHDEALSDANIYEEFFYNNMFTAQYQPQNDPNFSPYRDVDICIIYENEVVYWIFLYQFYQS